MKQTVPWKSLTLYRALSAAHGHWKSSWCLCSDSTELFCQYSMGSPKEECDERGQRIQHSSGCCFHISRAQGRAVGFTGSEKGRKALSTHKSRGVSGTAMGKVETCTPNSSYGESSKIPPWHLFKHSWERLCWPRVFPWQGCTQKAELKCSDSVWTMEMGDYQWPESFVQGVRICLIPGVNQSLMTELCLRPGWSTPGKFGGAGRKPRKEPESLLLIPSENAVSQSKAKWRETNTTIERLHLSLAETEIQKCSKKSWELQPPTLLQVYSEIQDTLSYSSVFVPQLSFFVLLLITVTSH